MVNYKDYDFTVILDRPDLQYSPYIAALDMQFSHHSPYLWTFGFDSTPEIAYGRSFEELFEFLETIKARLKLHRNGENDKHLLVVIVPSLFEFFAQTKKALPYSAEPFVSKSSSDVLLATLLDVFELHSYEAYFESDVCDDMLNQYGIITPEINADILSAACTLTEEEFDASGNKVYYMCSVFRDELNIKYQGGVGSLVLTKTTRVNTLFGAELRKDSNKSKCNLRAQIMKQNPITSEYGREFLIPLMYKAFIGGCVFFEDGVPNKEFENVHSVDMSSAYAARMVLSPYPVGKWEEMEQPASYTDLFKRPYSQYAMIISFTVEGVEVLPDGLAFLPAQFRNNYIDLTDLDEIADQIERASSTRIKKAHRLRLTLTDIDFKLFVQNYDFKRIRIDNVLGSLYGYLPDYVQRVIVQLYGAKAEAKERKAKLKTAGVLTLDEELSYDRIKSELARLYGIFTKRPIVKRYAFDTVTKEPKVVDKYYISDTAKFSAVLYHWGVWTPALVRKEIAGLRRELVEAARAGRHDIRVLSGDTDNINYIGNADDIIARYNENVKRQIERRAASMNIEPERLKGLGELTTDIYKKYKLTGLKQYCYIRETESGDVFEFKVGGMNRECDYFQRECKTPLQAFKHFGLGLTIPREYAPRIIHQPVSEHKVEEWIDRDGNSCRSECDSYIKEIIDKFTIAPLISYSGIAPDGMLPTKEAIEELADKIAIPVYNPLNYIKSKYIKEK